MTILRVLVGCESSGVVRGAFRAAGHDAWSCDLLPADDGSPFHYQCDVEALLEPGRWDLAVLHPPCTYLASSGLHWNTGNPERQAETARSLEFVQRLLDAPVERIALENPRGRISTAIRKPDQIVQPYEFGDDASKATCFWLKNLPRLKPVLPPVPPSMFVWEANKPTRVLHRWSNQSPSGENKLGPSPDRWKLRSKTYPGIAAAMVAAWG